MDGHEKARDAASEALVTLRRAMGLSQQRFAVEVMKTAITTVARWETSHPPGPEVLLKLAAVAEKEKLFDLRDTFRRLFVEDQTDGMGFELVLYTFFKGYIPSLKGGSETLGCLTLTLTNEVEANGAQDFLNVVYALRSDDPDARSAAQDALKALADAACPGGKIATDPTIGNLRYQSHVTQPTESEKEKQS